MKPTQNIIHSSAFNFEYESKAAALRGNVLIESIFHSHIMPEIEEAISKKIPEGVLVELSKLEINIGKIDEKDLSENLASRIRTSLEKALDFKLDVSKGLNGGDQKLIGQKSGNYIISSIEIFLTKGYFPYAMERELSIDELVITAIQNYKNEFADILKKHRNKDNVIRRTAFNLKQQIFDEIVFALEPVNADWIIGFRKILFQMKKEMNLNYYNETEFIQMLNYFILKYALNDTSSGFNKKNFSAVILSGIADILKPYSQVLIRSTQNTTEKSAIGVLIEETLVELQNEQKKISTEDGNKEIPLEQLVKILNAGKIDFSILNRGFLGKELIRTIHDEEKRALFVEKLNETGAKLILELFGKEKAQIFHKLIITFTEMVANKLDKTSTVNKLVLQTVLYLHQDAIRELDNEEFILFLVYSAGLDKSETVHSSAFLDFIQTQENISLKKISSAIKDEQEFQEISGIQNILSNAQDQPDIYKERKPNPTVVDKYFTIYKRKIIGYFLDSGHLPPAFENLNKNDVQQIFIDLLKVKDDFLAVQFKNNANSQHLIARLNILTTNRLTDVLHEYLIHFFRDEYAILSKTILEITQHLTFKTNRIRTKSFLNEIFIPALAESKGGSSPAVFTFFVLEELNAELAKDSTEPDKLFLFLLSKSGETLEIKTSVELDELPELSSGLFYYLLHQNQLDVNKTKNARLKTLLDVIKNDEKLYEKFIFGDTKNNKQHPSEDLNYLVSVLTFYAQKGFFPWWAAPISIPGLINELNKQSQILPQSFQEVLIQTEEQEHIFKQLIHKLSTDSLKDINAIFVNHAALKKIWEINLQKNKGLKSSSDSKENDTTNLIKNSRSDIDEFINEAYKDDDLLFKELYFFTDDEILSRWLGKSPQIAAQIREYLSITPYFYYRNVTPPQWRQAVFGFSLEYYGEDGKKQSTQFHNEFLNYLRKRRSNVNWTEILTTVYRVIQSSKNKGNVMFPAALVQLLNIEPAIRPTKNNTDNVENNVMTSDDAGIETKIYNAGLILLWPFLTRLFEQLSLVKQGAFISSESMNRAVYILQYLVYNETNFPEYELVLNKLLVGMLPDVHLEPFITLSEEEKDMTKSLLNGFINNWEKVNNSAPEGIQETFLQREGMLRFKEEEVLLNVEKKGVDVLLSSIPWNFSLIKLSWMKKPIHVEWI